MLVVVVLHTVGRVSVLSRSVLVSPFCNPRLVKVITAIVNLVLVIAAKVEQCV